MLFLLILDATFVFLRQGDAQRIVFDGGRQFVTGAINTTVELETRLETAMSTVSPNATATASIDASSGLLTAQISYPAEDTDLTGATGMLGGATIRVQSIHMTEQ